MPNVDFLSVDMWTEDDLDNLPSQEDEIHEYKSSATNIPGGLKEKICKAASAFWNSGGGYFIVGVDDAGKVDGGILELVNKTPIRDWVDQILFKNVHPRGKYKVRLIERQRSNSLIDQGSVVLVIGFAESNHPPHMYANKYYIRAGATSEPATHYIVEALRSRRGLYAPKLRAIVRYSPREPFLIELGILALNDSDAIDVEIRFDRTPKLLERPPENREFFRTIPVINRNNSLFMEISASGLHFEREPLTLFLKYIDIAGREYNEEQTINLMDNLPLLRPPDDRNVKAIEEALQNISKTIGKVASVLQSRDSRKSEQE